MTKLEAPDVVYANKKALKKGGAVIPIFRYAAVAAAASIALIFFLRGPELQQDYKPTASNLGEIEVISIPDYVVSVESVSTDENPITQTAEYATDPEFVSRDISKVKELSMSKFDGAVAALATDLGDQPEFKFQPQANEAQPATNVLPEPKSGVLKKVTQFADNKIVGTPKADATSSPLELLERGIEKVTKKKTQIKKDDSSDRKKFSLKIGKFEFSRSKKKAGK